MYDHVCIELKKSEQQPPTLPPPQKEKKKKTKTTTDICIRINNSKLSSLLPSLDETHRGVKTVVNTLLVGGSKSCR